MAKKKVASVCAHCGSHDTYIEDSVLEDTETLLEKVICEKCGRITYDVWKFVERKKER